MSRAATTDMLSIVRTALGRRCGWRGDEITDAGLSRALQSAAETLKIPSMEELIHRVCTPETDGGTALQSLLRRVTVGETTFFRHKEDLDWLRLEVLPPLVARREAAGIRRLRIWSAGCSTGEEAYTLAALALEAAPRGWDVQVLATDINDQSLDAAKRAHYGEWSFRGVEPHLRERWFDKVAPERWQPIEILRRVVDFEYLNLRDPIYPAILTRTTELDLVVCRNVFIYFFPEMVRTTLERFAACIYEDGAILCGPSDLFLLGPSDMPQLKSERPEKHRLRRASVGVTSLPLVTPIRRVARTPLRTPRPAASQPGEPPSAPTPTLAPAHDLMRLLSAGAFAETADRARALLERNPLDAEAARSLALALSRGHSAEAAAAWKRLLYISPADAEAHFALGLLLYRSDRRAEARAHFRTVMKLLDGRDDSETLNGPDALPIAWVRSACRSLSADGEAR